ncbi:MAG: hypothetical protein ACRYG6_04350 [Janthinobacterium lividum]
MTDRRPEPPERGPRGMDALLRDAVRAALHDHPAMLADANDAGPAPEAPRAAPRAPGGILFAEDFDAPEPPPPPPPAPEPTYSAVELADARETGRGEGWKAARAVAESEAEAQRAAVLQAVAAALSDARGAAESLASSAAESVARAALSLLAAALPATCARHGDRELRALAEAVLPALGTEPRIVVRASAAALRGLADTVARLDPDLAGRVQLVPTETLAPDEVRIAWQDGRAARDRRAIASAIEAVLAPLGLFEAAPAPHAPAARAGPATSEPTPSGPKEMADAG